MRFLIAVIVLLCASQAWSGEVVVSGAWVRASAPGQTSAAVQLSIASQQEVRLLGASSPAAGRAELHNMMLENGMMKMRRIQFVPLPAGRQVDLGTGGIHVMLLDLKQPLREGGSIQLALTVQHADRREEKIDVQVEVRSLTASGNAHEHH